MMITNLVSLRMRRSLALTAAVVAAGPILINTAPSAAEENAQPSPIVRVEEDWVLVVFEPDDYIYAPQFHTIMSPNGSLDGIYGQVTWNYSEYPDFVSGGFQVQGWNDDDLLTSHTYQGRELSDRAEVIMWTQVLDATNGNLTFSVTSGISTTWGYFGNGESKVVLHEGATDLSQYSPNTSVANAYITYGENRVAYLGIYDVRHFTADGGFASDTTPRVVYRFGLDDWYEVFGEN